MALIAELRAATGPAHQSLEERLGLFEKIPTLAGRQALVERFYGLHAGLEQALAPHLANWPGLDFESRRRAPRLAADLKVLGARPQDAPPHPAPVFADAAEALGVFYVLEGSTLGGAVIDKQLKAQGVSQEGLSFLHPYGDQTGARWRAFMAVLEAVPAAQGEAVVRGALLGFRLGEAWLCDENVAA